MRVSVTESGVLATREVIRAASTSDRLAMPSRVSRTTRKRDMANLPDRENVDCSTWMNCRSERPRCIGCATTFRLHDTERGIQLRFE